MESAFVTIPGIQVIQSAGGTGGWSWRWAMPWLGTTN